MNKEKINLVPCPQAFFLLGKVWWGCKSWSWGSHCGTMRGNQEICREANPAIKELLNSLLEISGLLIIYNSKCSILVSY